MTRNEAKDRVVKAASETYDDLNRWRDLPLEERGGLLSILSRLGKALNALDDSTPDSEGGWQPIETAPKDGTEILGFADRSQWVAWWSVENSRWEAGSVYFATELTHWQPLPAPPSQGQKPD